MKGFQKSAGSFRKIVVVVFIFSFSFCFTCLAAAELDLTKLSIEELMDIQVTSVTKKSQSLSDSAAAIFVITNDDLKRSGVTNIPDALRMVPGINVARIDSNKWAISARGFNGRFSAKLLVLIDGRSVYTPTFSGVYWEVNDVLLEDVERIEVIRGPGATLWGANAVNGVINIITKHTKDTQGGILSAGTGDFEKVITSVRYGGVFGENSHWRVYAKHQARDEFKSTTGEDANDDWEITQAGFRIDSELNEKNKFTVQGDIYQGDINQDLYLVDLTQFSFMDIFSFETDVSGVSILSRWQHTLSSASNFDLQVYYDTTKRTEDFLGEERHNIDIDFQHSFAAGTRQEFVWGLRYRYTEDDYTNSSVVSMDPTSERDSLYSAFVQDEISFYQDQVRLTLGSKFEHNEYSGYEIQPSARLLWAINPTNKVWGAVSRAVRTPSRSENDASFSYVAYDLSTLGTGPPGIPFVLAALGNEEFVSEELTAYELGYRFIPVRDFSVDFTLFYNEYENQRNGDGETPYFTGTSLQQDFIVSNSTFGETYGGELAMAFKPSDFFKLDLAYSFLKGSFNYEHVGGLPQQQVSLRGQFNLSKTLELDIWFRYVDEADASYILVEDNVYEIDSYFTMDLRLGWEITPSIEISLVGQNLLDETRVEFVQESFSQPVEIERSVYGVLSYRF